MFLQPNDHVLFYGDSITDCGQQSGAGEGLGSGYPALIAAHLNAQYPAHNFRFSNKGISGNRVYDLKSRLQNDVLENSPNVVSILIGINDTWRRYDSNTVSEIAEFEDAYNRVVSPLVSRNIRVMICEPFLLPIPADRIAWREDLDPRIAACRRVAVKSGALYLPLDGIFAAASTQRDAAFWAPDGVHPSLAGHGLIANAWTNLAAKA
jgi:acyl-CoA thioesterase-1